MSPRTTFLLTLAGVILVGLPLPALMQRQDSPRPQPTTEQLVCRTVYAGIQFSGHPRKLQLRHGNGEWYQVDTQHSPCEVELQLPLSGLMEIEVQGEWEETAPHAVTLTLEPDGFESRSATEWKEEGSHQLHSVFRFSW